MSNLNSRTSWAQIDIASDLPGDVQDQLDELDRRSALECKAVLVGWQGPSAARARLIDEVEARYRKHKATVMRQLSDRVGRLSRANS